MLTTIGEPLFVPPQILCDPSKLWSFSSLPPLTTTTQPLQHTLFFPCSRHHHHLQAFFFFFFFFLPLHQVDFVRFKPTAHFLLSDRFFKCLDREKKAVIMPPKKQQDQPKKKKATAEDKVGFFYNTLFIFCRFQGEKADFYSINRPLV